MLAPTRVATASAALKFAEACSPALHGGADSRSGLERRQEGVSTRLKPPRLDIEERSRHERRLGPAMAERRTGFGLVGKPNGENGKIRRHDVHRRMQPHGEVRQAPLVESGEGCGRKRRLIGRVIGEAACIFEARDVGEIRQRRRRRETGDERRKAFAVAEQQRRGWRLERYIGEGHGAEEVLSHQALDDGKARPQGFDQADGDGIAVDGETALGARLCRSLEAQGNGSGIGQQRPGELSLRVKCRAWLSS